MSQLGESPQQSNSRIDEQAGPPTHYVGQHGRIVPMNASYARTFLDNPEFLDTLSRTLQRAEGDQPETHKIPGVHHIVQIDRKASHSWEQIWKVRYVDAEGGEKSTEWQVYLDGGQSANEPTQFSIMCKGSIVISKKLVELRIPVQRLTAPGMAALFETIAQLYFNPVHEQMLNDEDLRDSIQEAVRNIESNVKQGIIDAQIHL